MAATATAEINSVIQHEGEAASNDIRDYLGDERQSGQGRVAPNIRRLFEQVPKRELRSNDLILKFTAADVQ